MNISQEELERITRRTQIVYTAVLLLIFVGLGVSVGQGVLSIAQATNTAFRSLPGLFLVGLLFWALSMLNALGTATDSFEEAGQE